MGKDTAISWTDHTFNIAWGCEKVSPGCANCYAERDSKRYGQDVWGPKKPRRIFGDKHWAEPLKWNDAAANGGIRKKVFCSSMCDIYEDHPTIDSQRERLWDVIRQTPWLIWQLLTKRPERILTVTPWEIMGKENVWFGTSSENQHYWDERVSLIRNVRSKVRFVSAEPLLGPINPPFNDLCNLQWVIIGGESGPKRRDDGSAFEWIMDLAGDCLLAHVPVWVKQDCAMKPGQQGLIPDHIWNLKQFPK